MTLVEVAVLRAEIQTRGSPIVKQIETHWTFLLFFSCAIHNVNSTVRFFYRSTRRCGCRRMQSFSSKKLPGFMQR
jgi:hypothetical protein